jgi:hypothetical protein
MKRHAQKRSSYLSADMLELRKRPIYVWGYDKAENFVCRIEINAAGLAVYSGKRGGKQLCDLPWESLVKKLKE